MQNMPTKSMFADLPKQINLPRKNHYYVDRGHDAAIEEALNKKAIAVISDEVSSTHSQTGKTALATHFVHCCSDNYDRVIWLSGASDDRLYIESLSCSRSYQSSSNHSGEASLEALKLDLETRNESWLIIIDDLQKPDLFQQLPQHKNTYAVGDNAKPTLKRKHHIRHHILITCPAAVQAGSDIPMPCVRLSTFTDDEVIALFEQRMQDKTDLDQQSVLTLAEQVNYRLADLDILSRLYANLEYRGRLLNRFQTTLSQSPGMNNSLWALSMAMFDSNEQAEVKQLLSFCAQLAATPIPKRWLTQACSKLAINDALIDTMIGKGILISADTSAQGTSLTLLEPLRRAIRDTDDAALHDNDDPTLAQQEQRCLVNIANEILQQGTDTDGSDAFLWKRTGYTKRFNVENEAAVVLHAIAILEQAASVRDQAMVLSLATLANSIGRFYYNQDNFVRAAAFYEKAQTLLETLLPDALENNWQEILLSSDEDEQKRIFTELGKGFDADTALFYSQEVLHNLGSTAIRASEGCPSKKTLKKAAQQLELAYCMQAHNLETRAQAKEDSEQLAQHWHHALYTQRNLARAYKKRGKLLKAYGIICKLNNTQDDRIRLYYLNRPETRQLSCMDKGVILRLLQDSSNEKKDYSQAIKFFELALKECDDTQYPVATKAYDTAVTCVRLAETYQACAKNPHEKKKAKKEYYNKALDRLKSAKALAPTHKFSLTSRIAYRQAETSFALGRYHDAKVAIEDAIVQLTTAYPTKHGDFLVAYHHLSEQINQKVNPEESAQKLAHFKKQFIQRYLTGLQHELTDIENREAKLELALGITAAVAKAATLKSVSASYANATVNADLNIGEAPGEIAKALSTYYQASHQSDKANLQTIIEGNIVNNLITLSDIIAKQREIQLCKLTTKSIEVLVDYAVRALVCAIRKGNLSLSPDNLYSIEEQLMNAIMDYEGESHHLKCETQSLGKGWETHGFFSGAGLKAQLQTETSNPTTPFLFFIRTKKKHDKHRLYGYGRLQNVDPNSIDDGKDNDGKQRWRLIYSGACEFKGHPSEHEAERAFEEQDSKKCLMM